MNQRHIALSQQFQELAADFINLHSNRTSLITITNTELNKTYDKVFFYVSIFPESAEGPALGFLLRNRGECKHFIKEHSRIGKIPHIEFILDTGEKNRQRVDELLNQ